MSYGYPAGMSVRAINSLDFQIDRGRALPALTDGPGRGPLEAPAEAGRMQRSPAPRELVDLELYAWRKKYGGLSPSELQRLKQLESENRKLKGLVADLSLDKQILQDVLAKKL